ncbi:MAG: DUF4124 domain-containing protein [Burkholderiaceae bacterium]|nr:DUF4124 domain-containing protein [Pseudomonadota bacterium]MCO5117132.1 DUF4124 domain-containing protein [Burkholderiaceae bacterium]MCP5220006.1 DUF4124 domain-containing protein [Burkholderiaceae bacterium]
MIPIPTSRWLPGALATLVALALGLPLAAAAQAYKCVDAASGRTLYTDQPCKGGATVVPRPTDEQLRLDAERAQQARERGLQEREQAVQREQDRLDAARAAEAQRPPPVPPSESAACRVAREEASFRAASVTASEEQIRTARANAALACGQPAPPEIVVAPPPRWRPHPWPDRPPPVRPRPVASQPSYAPGTEPLPMR